LCSLLPPISSPPLFPSTTLFRSNFRHALDFPKIRDMYNHLLSIWTNGALEVVFVRFFKPVQVDKIGNNFYLFFNIKSLIGFISEDRKSTRLNSSHVSISYAVFCL